MTICRVHAAYKNRILTSYNSKSSEKSMVCHMAIIMIVTISLKRC